MQWTTKAASGSQAHKTVLAVGKFFAGVNLARAGLDFTARRREQTEDGAVVVSSVETHPPELAHIAKQQLLPPVLETKAQVSVFVGSELGLGVGKDGSFTRRPQEPGAMGVAGEELPRHPQVKQQRRPVVQRGDQVFSVAAEVIDSARQNASLGPQSPSSTLSPPFRRCPGCSCRKLEFPNATA